MIHRCNYILLSQVYCVWNVVKTPTIILNNPVFPFDSFTRDKSFDFVASFLLFAVCKPTVCCCRPDDYLCASIWLSLTSLTNLLVRLEHANKLRRQKQCISDTFKQQFKIHGMLSRGHLNWTERQAEVVWTMGDVRWADEGERWPQPEWMIKSKTTRKWL